MPVLTTPLPTAAPPSSRWASDSARKYALSLLRERDHEQLSGRALQTALDLVAGNRKIFPSACSLLIDTLKKMPMAGHTTPRPVVPGIYLVDGHYVKILASRTTDNLYAKQWIGDMWSYVPGLVSQVSADDALTAEQAKAFGDRYHVCVFCSTELTDDRSITAGYGPTCAGNYGLPWGDR